MVTRGSRDALCRLHEQTPLPGEVLGAEPQENVGVYESFSNKLENIAQWG